MTTTVKLSMQLKLKTTQRKERNNKQDKLKLAIETVKYNIFGFGWYLYLVTK